LAHYKHDTLHSFREKNILSYTYSVLYAKLMAAISMTVV